jgi:hypothetical protein
VVSSFRYPVETSHERISLSDQLPHIVSVAAA